MDVTLESIPSSENAVLRRLLELYVYDFSDFWPSDISDKGLYIQDEYFTYLCSEKVRRFFIKVDGNLAGCIVLAFESAIGSGAVNDILYFFVLRVYRRTGVGRIAAKELFSKFSGNWEVREAIENVPATKFWRSVIGEFSGGDFTEKHVKNSEWDGYVQLFTSRNHSK